MKHGSQPHSLSAILDALNDETGRLILLRLERQELRCSELGDLGAKSRLSYHFAVLEEEGLIKTRREGTKKYLSLDQASTFVQSLVNVVLRAEEGETDVQLY